MSARKPARPRILTAQAAKAHWAAVLVFLGQLQVVMTNGGMQSLAELTSLQWIAIAIVTLTAWGATYGISNSDPKGTDQ